MGYRSKDHNLIEVPGKLLHISRVGTLGLVRAASTVQRPLVQAKTRSPVGLSTPEKSRRHPRAAIYSPQSTVVRQFELAHDLHYRADLFFAESFSPDVEHAPAVPERAPGMLVLCSG